jgi:hypothetical protein
LRRKELPTEYQEAAPTSPAALHLREQPARHRAIIGEPIVVTRGRTPLQVHGHAAAITRAG